MSRADLAGPVLAAVSRSFYLSLRLLPGGLREPISLAYLLARTSDTMADTARAPAAVRIEHLASFGRMVAGEGGDVRALQADLHPEAPGEQVLLAQMQGCLDWLGGLPEADREETRALLQKIIRGQSLDLERFGAGGEGVIALATAEELEEYTYLVAGCVGEYWTRICARHLPGYSSVPLEELSRLGRHYGQGLQLVNILRDLPEDLRQGRCYLPAAEIAAPARLLVEPESARAAFNHWLQRAREYLEEGRQYLRAIRPARVRMGCYLPWTLGEATLRLLERQYPLTHPVRLKVPRRAVYGALLRALPVAVSNWPLG